MSLTDEQKRAAEETMQLWKGDAERGRGGEDPRDDPEAPVCWCGEYLDEQGLCPLRFEDNHNK